MKIPLFPLQSVFFPGERIPLHIFEERYKQLIHDCREEAIAFGIPVYIEGTLAYGTEMKLEEIMNTYDNGEMDVICTAKRVFKVLTFDNQMGEKLYAGGIVEFLDNEDDGTNAQRETVLSLIEELYALMNVPFSAVSFPTFNSYTLVHKIGLSIVQEHELLQMTHESERLSYLRAHLKTTISVLQEVNRTKKIIDMNGHFRNFDPLDFEDFKL
ncbi:LON peptidase substrate-binding domain-containing protein [Spongiimicrobium sp. 2-473A-2-J]|uniref:LON peptidase substrate-binding domain-containing protein n=1 Tax=Eudoraea algarum TaxID=3417568 RepID=UPI003D3662A1